jgi:hypothetical protein
MSVEIQLAIIFRAFGLLQSKFQVIYLSELNNECNIQECAKSSLKGVNFPGVIVFVKVNSGSLDILETAVFNKKTYKLDCVLFQNIIDRGSGQEGHVIAGITMKKEKWLLTNNYFPDDQTDMISSGHEKDSNAHRGINSCIAKSFDWSKDFTTDNAGCDPRHETNDQGRGHYSLNRGNNIYIYIQSKHQGGQRNDIIFTKTDEKTTLKSKKYLIYVGKRGGRYIKKDGKYCRLRK